MLKGTAVVLTASSVARSGSIAGALPWAPDTAEPPARAIPGAWRFLTAAEAAALEALADRIVPPDPETPGGRDAGCAVFIDRQLAGPYGGSDGWYNQGPFAKGIKQQGPQSSQVPRDLYRSGLKALDQYCHAQRNGKAFQQLSAAQQDELLHGLEDGTVQLDGVDGKTFLQAAIKDVQMGFFADPIYGGNRDMCAWKMIGFPGARYDYRDWVSKHNERYPHPPVSIAGRADWSTRKA